jgi:hypothetical protein
VAAQTEHTLGSGHYVQSKMTPAVNRWLGPNFVQRRVVKSWFPVSLSFIVRWQVIAPLDYAGVARRGIGYQKCSARSH